MSRIEFCGALRNIIRLKYRAAEVEGLAGLSCPVCRGMWSADYGQGLVAGKLDELIGYPSH